MHLRSRVLVSTRELKARKEATVKRNENKLIRLLFCGALVCAMAVRAGSAEAQQANADAGDNKITAIDILLEPDATMLEHCKANNARLLKVYPQGFALDAAHRPHITLVQRFVRTADLGNVYAAAGKVFASTNLKGMTLEAFKYYYTPTGTTGVAGIVMKPTPELLKLQAEIIAAVTPFTVETGPITAFTKPHGDPALDVALIGYV